MERAKFPLNITFVSQQVY